MSEQIDNRRAVVEQILDRIATDPTYRQQLVDNPAQALEALRPGSATPAAGDDTSGYMMCQGPPYTCDQTCGGSGPTCRVTY
jgi:hypothetical protein